MEQSITGSKTELSIDEKYMKVRELVVEGRMATRVCKSFNLVRRTYNLRMRKEGLRAAEARLAVQQGKPLEEALNDFQLTAAMYVWWLEKEQEKNGAGVDKRRAS